MIFNKKEYMKKYRLERKEYYKKKTTEWKLKNKEYFLNHQKEYRLRNKEKSREQKLKKNYGLTLKQYEDMLKNQNYKCFICTKKFNNINPSLKPCVDHDHETGKIRSILCLKCNFSIGLLSEDIITISNMKDYLHKNKTDELLEKIGGIHKKGIKI